MARTTPRFARLRDWYARRPFVTVGGLSFVAGFVIVALWLLPDTFRTVESKVPNVVGLQFADARARLQAAGFEATEGESQNHPTAPKGSVLGQLPSPGALEARGTTIILDVSLGAKRGTVPNVAGLTRREAELALATSGFDLGDVTERVDARPRGEVVATVPAIGQSLLQPAAVSLVVSAGPDAVAVPTFVGMPVEEALALIEQVGLVAGPVRSDSSSTQPEGTVAAQSPRSGALLPPGGTVILTIARPAPAVPDDETPFVPVPPVTPVSR